MTQPDMSQRLDSLIATWENEVVEFKQAGNDYSTDDIGKYFSALANEANLRGSHAISGSQVDRRYFQPFMPEFTSDLLSGPLYCLGPPPCTGRRRRVAAGCKTYRRVQRSQAG